MRERYIPAARAAMVGVVAALAIASLPSAARTSDDAGEPFRLLDTWPIPEAPAHPVDVAISAGGRLFTVDGLHNEVLFVDGFGRLVERVDHPPVERSSEAVFVPIAIAADGSRELLYIVWSRHDAGPEFASRGLFLDARRFDGEAARPLLWIGTSIPAASDLAVHAASGDLFVLGGHQIARLRLPAGVVDGLIDLDPTLPDVRRIAATFDDRLVLVREDSTDLDVLSLDGAFIESLTVPSGVPVAVAADQTGAVHALVRPDLAGDPDPNVPLLVTFAGGTATTRAAAALQAPPIPDGRWPWAIDAAVDGLALSTAAGRFRLVHLRSAAGPERHAPLIGSRTIDRYVPGPPPVSVDAPMMIDTDDDGDLIVLDGRSSRLLRFDETGVAELAGGAPDGAVDVAAGEAEARFVSTRDGRLVRLASGDVEAPLWSVACECPFGGRLAAGPGVVYATRPGERAVAAFDATTGAPVRVLHSLDGLTLWPSDAAVGGGLLYTSDVVTARIQGWTLGPDAAVEWSAGLLSGPRRLASGRADDGHTLLAGLMGDGFVELHDVRGANLIARWQPVLDGGRVLYGSDIALGRSQQVYIADSERRQVHVFGPAAGIPATPGPSPTPTASPTPAGDVCRLDGDMFADPTTLLPGEAAYVNITLDAECPAASRVIGADIVLTIDRSGSMLGSPIAAARASARSFAELLDVRYHRLGVASFSTDASMDVPLTDSITTVIGALEGLVPDGGTNITAAIERSRENLERFGRPDALPVIVLLTDGRHNADGSDPTAVAAAARAWGAQLYVVGLGDEIDREVLGAVAGSPDRLFLAPTPDELFPIYRKILQVVLDSLAGNVIIEDTVAGGVTFLRDTASPPALVAGSVLRWGRSILPSGGITLTYAVRPRDLGCTATNERTWAEYTDSDGARRSYVFPVPTVCVVTPTPPPPTATIEPTPAPAPIFIPLASNGSCIRIDQGADVVLLIDTSASMEGPKLAQAQAAAREFIDRLDLRRDQAAVIGFDDTARIATHLTGDRAQLDRAVAELAAGRGTRIDRALDSALVELLGPRRKTSNRAAVVLLSDGAHSGPTESVLRAAAEIEIVGALVYSVGLGADIDRELLELISSPSRFYHAPEPEELSRIYREIARTIPCP